MMTLPELRSQCLLLRDVVRNHVSYCGGVDDDLWRSAVGVHIALAEHLERLESAIAAAQRGDEAKPTL